MMEGRIENRESCRFMGTDEMQERGYIHEIVPCPLLVKYRKLTRSKENEQHEEKPKS